MTTMIESMKENFLPILKTVVGIVLCILSLYGLMELCFYVSDRFGIWYSFIPGTIGMFLIVWIAISLLTKDEGVM
jgi:uncharacterized membrane protein YeaQ/YmgE (transglycosylase-associated protein family)